MGHLKNIQYITNALGKKKYVVLPIEDYEELLEDIQDLATITERKEEGNISIDNIIKNIIAKHIEDEIK